jgi:hypothetical protein
MINEMKREMILPPIMESQEDLYAVLNTERETPRGKRERELGNPEVEFVTLTIYSVSEGSGEERDRLGCKARGDWYCSLLKTKSFFFL